jgi:hypothetical protein
MSSMSTHRRDSRYLVVGACIGLFVGLLIAGPNFHAWPVALSLSVVFGCVLGSVIVAVIAVQLFANSLASGSSSIQSSGDPPIYSPELQSSSHDTPHRSGDSCGTSGGDSYDGSSCGSDGGS